MTEQQAIAFCEDRRDELRVDPDMQPEGAEKAIVRYKQDPDTPGPTEDRVAWIVTYSCSWGMMFVHVDDAHAQILEVKQTA